MAIVIVRRIDLIRQRINLLRQRQQIDLFVSACQINVRNATGVQKNRTLDLEHSHNERFIQLRYEDVCKATLS